MRHTAKYVLSASSLAILASGPLSHAQEEEARQDTVVVTGSFIQGTPEDAALPVDVLSADDLKLEGNPSITELIRNLGVSSGVDGQTNQFTSNGIEGTSNINLRGLGPARTLVLVNGRRESVSPFAIGEQAQLFVDTNMIPSAAVKRIEVLKDGAAALYGSDAIAGVVNFITNDDLHGVQLGGNFESFEGTDGNYDLSGAFGYQGEDWGWVTSVGYQYRPEVQLLEKDWGVVSYAEAPAGGWSTIGNPGSFVATPNVGPGSAVAGTPLAFANSDDQCSLLGGVDGGVLCRFQYTNFDNLVEQEERYQIFSEFNKTFENGIDLHIEGLFGHTDVPEWKTSPAYPPQALFGQIVLPDHPGLVQYIADNPSWAAATYTDYNPLLTGGAPSPYDPTGGMGGLNPGATPLIFFGRAFGWGGFPGTDYGPQEGFRKHDHYRLSGSLNGEFENGINWDMGLTYSQTDSERVTNDTSISGFEAALRGYGVCVDAVTGLDPANGESPLSSTYTGSLSAGQGSCEYYNPFSNAIPAGAINGVANPQYDPALQNSETLANWLTLPNGSERTTSLLVFDGVINGASGVQAAGGEVGFAAGFQVRKETYEVTPYALSDLSITPGPGGTGPTSFLAGLTSADEEQTIYALFGEVQIPLYDNLDIQAAVRFEDYGGEVGSTFDPKVAAKWTVNDKFAIRGSAQTSFRGPTLNQLSGVGTTLQYIAPTGAFKAVDTYGNGSLSPESAFSYNIGGIFEHDGLFASIDYYSFDFSDPIIVEDHNPIVNAALAALSSGNTSADILTRITFDGAQAAGNISRIETNIVNGPDIQTSGIDVRLEKMWQDVGPGAFTLGLDATFVLDYEVDDFIIEDATIVGGDRSGQLNRSNFSRPLPELKGNLYGNYNFDMPWGNNNIRAIVRYIDSYNDERTAGLEVDSQTTFDLFYTTELPYQFDLGLSVINITDEDPPFAVNDLNYDPYTHNPFGRTFKVSLSKKFDFAQ